MKLHNYSVYILECRDGSYYTGVTNNLERRLWEHDTRFNVACYTYAKRPLILKHCETTKDVKQAILREKQLKGWSRKKKEALFIEDWDKLIRLSRSSVRQAQDDMKETGDDMKETGDDMKETGDDMKEADDDTNETDDDNESNSRLDYKNPE